MPKTSEGDGLLTVADALRRGVNASTTTTREDEAFLGGLAVCAAAIRQESDLAFPPTGPLAHLATALAALPPQFECLQAASRVGQWISIAALCELANAPDLAWLILDALHERLSKTVAAEAGVESVAELRGLCWARRGRIARSAGRLHDASVCYVAAQRTVRGLPWRDAAPHAALGLAVVAVGRGNLPAADRRASGVLKHRPTVSAMYRVQAHQVRAFTLRRKGRLLDALLHSWHAFDLLDSSDVRRFELLVTMGEIAVAYGDWPAAMAGLSVVVQSTATSRVRIPALMGLLDGHRRLGDRASTEYRDDAMRWILDLETFARATGAPGDRVLAAIALAEALLGLDYLEKAHEWIEIVEQEAERHGFHEKRFRAEALRAELVQKSQMRVAERITEPVPAPRAFRVQREQHPALRRLTALAGAHATGL